jgi:hypothetical protein
VASNSGNRIASLLCGTWLLVAAAPASAIDAGGGSGGGSGAAGGAASEAETAESAEPAEQEEEAPEVAEPRPAREVASDSQQEEQKIYAVPPPPDAPREGLDPSPGRTEFMRRLRANAEELERAKLSEPTQVHTQGDVIVLSNVDNVATARATTAPDPSAPTPEAAPRLPIEDVAHDANDVTREASLVTDSPPARQKEAPAEWHWLWILAGVATVLLVPIAMLLTRATRSS